MDSRLGNWRPCLSLRPPKFLLPGSYTYSSCRPTFAVCRVIFPWLCAGDKVAPELEIPNLLVAPLTLVGSLVWQVAYRVPCVAPSCPPP